MKTKAEVAKLLNSIFNNELYINFFQVKSDLLDEVDSLRSAGQKEYAGRDDNAFGNFERLASMLELNRESILFVYMAKHLDGIVSYLNGHKSQREDVRGRINDVIVYLILLRAMIDDKKSGSIEDVSGIVQFEKDLSS